MGDVGVRTGIVVQARMGSRRMREPVRVLIYACGDHAVGMGHVTRMLALAQALEQQDDAVEIRFMMPKEGEGSREVASSGYAVDDVEMPHAFEPDVVIVDLPDTDPRLFEGWRGRGAVTVSIDQPGLVRYRADLAFSMLYAPLVPRDQFSMTEEYGGPRYAILRPEFGRAPRKTIQAVAHHVLLLQGGSDSHGASPRLCRALRQIHRPMAVDVVVGPAFRCDRELAESIGSDPRFTVRRQPASIQALMEEADVAVSAAGITALELAAVGVPMLLVVSEPKEAETARALDREGIAVDLGEGNRLSDAQLAGAVVSLLDDYARRTALSRRSQERVDGQGGGRVAERILARAGERHARSRL